MSVPSNVVKLCYVVAFRKNPLVLERTGVVASETPFEATVAFDTANGRTVACKWRMGKVTYLG